MRFTMRFHLELICSALISVTLLSAPVIAFAGPGGTGGGNFEAADFVASARSLQGEISASEAWANLGVSSLDFEKAITSTHVYCAAGARLQRMMNSKFNGFYEQSVNSIYLVCPQWSSPLSANQKMTLFHEYMRVLGREGADYSISSQIKSSIDRARASQQRRATLDLEAAIWDGDIPKIYESVQKGADLNRPENPAVYAVAAESGVHWTEIGRVRDDARSGSTIESSQKVSLITYLIQHGANPNVLVTTGTSQGHAALHVATDAATMATLLDDGANPLLVAETGEQPLLDFLASYPYSNNKAYFRMIVERLIVAGSDLNNCYADHSGCVMSEVAKVGDAELVALFSKSRTVQTAR